MNLIPFLDRVVTKVERYADAGRALPPWLKKQAKAVQLVGTDFDRGLALLIDGLQEERDSLEDWSYD